MQTLLFRSPSFKSTLSANLANSEGHGLVIFIWVHQMFKVFLAAALTLLALGAALLTATSVRWRSCHGYLPLKT